MTTQETSRDTESTPELTEQELLDREVASLDECFDLEQRPEAYFGGDAELRASLLGEWRRQQVLAELDAGRGAEVPEALFASKLDDRLRDFIGGIHPSMMGGEYLPALKSNEIEIARVCLESTTADVISVRAELRADGYHYSVVDEYQDEGDAYQLKLEHSEEPLSLGELIQLVDTCSTKGVSLEASYGADRGALGLVMPFYYQQWECGDDAQGMLDFVSVRSEFYPALGSYYFNRGVVWREVIDRDLEEEEDEDAGL